MYQVKTTRPHTGWSAEEDAQLLEKAAAAQRHGQPMRSVFEEMALLSGRRPNSVRNYYYARVKTDEGKTIAHNPAFVPFTPEESRRLLSDVLTAQAAGESVRACTLRLAEGDNRRMLRYQNKYRQLIKSDPALVRGVVASLRKRALPAFDPYAPPTDKKRAGRPKKQPRELAELVETLSRVEGLDVAALLQSLGALAVSAVNGAKAQRQLSSAREEAACLAQENERLTASLARSSEALSAQQERYLSLLGYFRQLVRVNTEFLKTNPAGKRAELAGYLRDLQTSVASCEKLMVEANP